MIFSCTWLVGGFSVSWDAWTILSRAWLRLPLLRYADDLVLYKHSWFAQRSINLNVSLLVHSLSLSAFFEGLQVFFFWFHSRLHTWPLHCTQYNKNNKKINRNKKLQTIKILGKFKLRISLSCFCHQTSVSNKGCVALHLEKYLQLKREVISTSPLCFFRLFFDRRPLWFLFNPSLLQKLLK